MLFDCAVSLKSPDRLGKVVRLGSLIILCLPEVIANLADLPFEFAAIRDDSGL